jgi:hypothetical protein
MTEKQYRKLDAVSYSSLSKLASSPRAFKLNQESTEDKQSSAMILGSVVDIMLTEPKRFDEEVYVMTTGKPGSEMMLKFCENLAETGDGIKAFQASGYKQNPQASAKFEKEGKSYYEAILAGQGKMIIGAEDFFKANQIVETLKTNLFTKGYFVPNRDPDIELRFQEVVQWVAHFVPIDDPMHKGEDMMKIKSMIDIIHINHRTGVITPIDLKTGAEGFMKSYWKYKRYLQAAMYTDSLTLHTWGESNFDNPGSYTIAPLKFIYADTNLFYPPMIYSSTNEDISIGVDGLSYLVPVAGLAKSFRDDEIHKIDTVGFGPSHQIKIKGYRQLIAELDWHIRMDQWNYTYEDFHNGGERQIDAFMVKL